MSTDLSVLLGKRKSVKNKSENDNDDSDEENATAKKTVRRGRKSKEERQEEQAELERKFKENYRCDFASYTILSLDMKPSRIDPRRLVSSIQWLDDLAPPPDVVGKISMASQRLAAACKSGAHGQIGWHEQRNQRSITASMIARALCMSDPHLSGTHRFIQSTLTLLEKAKLAPAFQGNALTEYGVENEPFCCKVYMQERHKESLLIVGFLAHPTNPYCGATPDGISLDGRKIMEFKCPTQRYFQEGDHCPVNYWHQCQLGMEVCNAIASTDEDRTCFEKTDYFEMRHMKRPRGLRTNCVAILRDKTWFESIKPLLKQYEAHLKRLRLLAQLFPSDMLMGAQNSNIKSTENTITKMFTKVVLKE